MTEDEPDYKESRLSKGKTADAVRRDEAYYIQGAFVVFQVEDRLFRLPSYLFANESEVFQSLFLLPQGDCTEAEASATSNPIVLPEEHSQDFKSLVKALYPKRFSVQLSSSNSEWISVLKLATKWYFLRLREMAIIELERLQELTFVEKVTLGRKCRISSWVISGLKELVYRNATVSDKEAMKLDADIITTAYKVYRMREGRILKTILSVTEEIENIFGDELEAIRADQKGYEYSDADPPSNTKTNPWNMEWN